GRGCWDFCSPPTWRLQSRFSPTTTGFGGSTTLRCWPTLRSSCLDRVRWRSAASAGSRPGCVKADRLGAVSVDAEGYGFPEHQRTLSRLMDDIRILAPAGGGAAVAPARGEPAGRLIRLARWASHQLGQVRQLERGGIDRSPALDQLPAELVGLRVVHRQDALNDALAKVKDREGQRFAVATPNRRVIAGGVAAVFQAHVVLVGPEVRKFRIWCMAPGDGGGDPASLALGNLPVLDADRPAQDR